MTSLYFDNEEFPTAQELLKINQKVLFTVLSKNATKLLNYQQAKNNKFTEVFFVNSKLISPYNDYVTTMITFDDTFQEHEYLPILLEIRNFFNFNAKLLMLTMSHHGCYTTRTAKNKECILVYSSAIKELNVQIMNDLLQFGKIPALLHCNIKARVTLKSVEDIPQKNIINAVENQLNSKVTKIVSLNFNRLISTPEKFGPKCYLDILLSNREDVRSGTLTIKNAYGFDISVTCTLDFFFDKQVESAEKAHLDTSKEIITEKTALVIKKMFKNTKLCVKKLCMKTSNGCNFAHNENDLCTYEHNLIALTAHEIDTIKEGFPQLDNKKKISKSKNIIISAINLFDKYHKNGFFKHGNVNTQSALLPISIANTSIPTSNNFITTTSSSIPNTNSYDSSIPITNFSIPTTNCSFPTTISCIPTTNRNDSFIPAINNPLPNSASFIPATNGSIETTDSSLPTNDSSILTANGSILNTNSFSITTNAMSVLANTPSSLPTYDSPISTTNGFILNINSSSTTTNVVSVLENTPSLEGGVMKESAKFLSANVKKKKEKLTLLKIIRSNLANNTGILDSTVDDTNTETTNTETFSDKVVTENTIDNNGICITEPVDDTNTETFSDKVVTESTIDNNGIYITEPKIDNNVVFMGKKYQDVKNEKVEKLGAQTRSKSSGIPPVKNFEDKSYKLAVISPKKNNSANGRNFIVLKRETPKSE